MLLRLIIISERVRVCRGSNRGVAYVQQVGGGVKSSSSVWVNTRPLILIKNFKISEAPRSLILDKQKAPHIAVQSVFERSEMLGSASLDETS
jgi:hypothetical protein